MNPITCTCFDGDRLLAAGTLPEVVSVVKKAVESGSHAILVFDDVTGRLVDLDLRYPPEDVVARLTPYTGEPEISAKTRDRGRPKLGVVAREVTLLPRHWEWLATQPGGASVTLRRLVEEARRNNVEKDRIRNAQNRAYKFISTVAGNMQDFEEATRALFANDRTRFESHMTTWPTDIREYALRLAYGDTPVVEEEV
jgi:hypothetical protein